MAKAVKKGIVPTGVKRHTRAKNCKPGARYLVGFTGCAEAKTQTKET